MLVIATSNAGERGETGSLTLRTGMSSEGSSGNISISSGEAHIGNPLPWTTKMGRGGSIHISVGTGDDGDGGNIKILSGSTMATSSIKNPFKPATDTGGSIELASGASYSASSGEISISTADAGLSGVSGHLQLKTGEATSGMAGYIGKFLSNECGQICHVTSFSYLTLLMLSFSCILDFQALSLAIRRTAKVER
jgi:hypothetical protein